MSRFIYSASDDGSVRKIDPSGNQVWSFTGHTGSVRVVRFAAGFVYTGSADGTVRKLDASNGNQVWSVTMPGSAFVEDVTVTSDGIVYAAIFGQIIKIDSATGNDSVFIGKLQFGEPPEYSAVAVDHEQNVYVNWRIPGLIKVERYPPTYVDPGSPDSDTQATSRFADLATSIAGNAVFLAHHSGAGDSRLRRLSRSGLSVVGNLLLSGKGFHSDLAVDPEFVYVSGVEGWVQKRDYAFNLVWEYTGIDSVLSVDVDPEGFVYAGGDDATLRKIDSSGNEVWSFTGHTDEVHGIAVESGVYGSGLFEFNFRNYDLVEVELLNALSGDNPAELFIGDNDLEGVGTAEILVTTVQDGEPENILDFDLLEVELLNALSGDNPAALSVGANDLEIFDDIIITPSTVQDGLSPSILDLDKLEVEFIDGGLEDFNPAALSVGNNALTFDDDVQIQVQTIQQGESSPFAGFDLVQVELLNALAGDNPAALSTGSNSLFGEPIDINIGVTTLQDGESSPFTDFDLVQVQLLNALSGDNPAVLQAGSNALGGPLQGVNIQVDTIQEGETQPFINFDKIGVVLLGALSGDNPAALSLGVNDLDVGAIQISIGVQTVQNGADPNDIIQLSFIGNHAQQSLNRLITQYQQKPVLTEVVESLTEQIQEIEDSVFDYKNRLDPFELQGQLLDRFGQIVIQERSGLSDDFYRLVLLIKIAINTSQGNPETIISAFRLLTQAGFVRYLNLKNGEIQLFTDGELAEDAQDLTFSLLEQALAAGVKVEDFIFFDDENPFSFAGPNVTVPKGGFGTVFDSSIGGLLATLRRKT